MKSPHTEFGFIMTPHKKGRGKKSKIKRPSFKRPDNAKLLVKDWNREANSLIIKSAILGVRVAVQMAVRLSTHLTVWVVKTLGTVVSELPSRRVFELKPKWSWVIIAFLLGLLLARPVDTVHGQPRPEPIHNLIPAKVSKLTVKRFKKIKPVYIAPPAPTVIVGAVVKSQRVIAGNNYTPGNCTWYVKSKRPDIPNNWGDAYVWIGSAQASGYKTGSVPRVGAIGQAGIHVVYVERVNGNGTVYISEMNYVGLGVVSDRTVPASTFTYIY